MRNLIKTGVAVLKVKDSSVEIEDCVLKTNFRIYDKKLCAPHLEVMRNFDFYTQNLQLQEKFRV